jgi:hypothetical protein
MAKQQSFAHRGTIIWRLNRFRQYLLLELVEDLKQLETDGLTDTECNHVKECLRQIIDECKRRHDKGVVEIALTKNLEQFRDIYIQWNGPRGSDPQAIKERQSFRKKIAEARRELSEDIRGRQLVLAGVIDDSFCDELWNRLEKICQAYPGEFSRLKRGFQRVRGSFARAVAA